MAAVILAFIKRRWVLLMGMVVIAGCSVIDSVHVGHQTWGVFQGCIMFFDDGLPKNPGTRWGQPFHHPMMGPPLPIFFSWGAYYKGLVIPLWLPLSSVIAWIVLREMRRKRKRPA